MKMKRLILILCCLILFPLTACADQANNASENNVQQEAVKEAPQPATPQDWGDNDFESSFEGVDEPSFGEEGDQGG